MMINAKSGACLAAAAAVLVMAGTQVASAAEGSKSGVKCYGVNACKGNSACKSAGNACKGQNACKGTGFVPTSADACKQLGGATAPKKA